MIETMRPAPPEVLDEFARVRERLLAEFDLDAESESGPVQQYFDERELYRHPAIAVPRTEEGFAAARAITAETAYPLPFVTSKFSEDNDLNDIYSPGAMGFSVPAYQINFISTMDSLPATCKEDVYTQFRAPNIRVHELAHSVFHADPTILLQEVRGQTVLYEHYPLSGWDHRIYHSGGEPYSAQPKWAEEAFAVHVAGDYRRITETPTRSEFEFRPSGNRGPVFIGGQYCIEFPDETRNYMPLDGAIAGETLDILDGIVPGTVNAMFGIARKEVNPEEFRNELKQKLGPGLFKLMFEEQPQERWLRIYYMVDAL